MEFEEIKKCVNEIDVLKENINRLERILHWNGYEILRPDLLNILYDVELEDNTKMLIKESAERMLMEMKKLLEYELGERNKKLNIAENEKHLRQA
jgi:hypothetical protein